MSWVVDTPLIFDVLEADPHHGAASVALLRRHLTSGLLISHVSYIELAPAFHGSQILQDEFLSGLGVRWDEPWTEADSRSAHEAFAAFTERRPESVVCAMPNLLIGAFASRFEGLLTRAPRAFVGLYPDLRVEVPGDKHARPKKESR